MSKKRKELSHEEIWDDSALVDSWNEAVEEYKARDPMNADSLMLMATSQYYYSLHARGEKVEQVLDQVEAGEQEGLDDGHEDGEAEDGEIEDDEGMVGGGEEEQAAVGFLEHDPKDASSGPFQRSANHGHQTQQQPTPNLPPLATVPGAVLGAGQDESMKNLMMSWYYAGYYTGIYEGQKQAAGLSSGATGDPTSRPG